MTPPLKCVNVSPRGLQDSLPTVRQVLLRTAPHGTLAQSVRIGKWPLLKAVTIVACQEALTTYAAWESAQKGLNQDLVLRSEPH